MLATFKRGDYAQTDQIEDDPAILNKICPQNMKYMTIRSLLL